MHARLIATAAAVTILTLTSGTAAVADGPALSDGTPSIRLQPGNVAAYSSANTHRVGMISIALNFPDGRTIPVGTSLHTTVYSCDAFVKEATTVRQSDSSGSSAAVVLSENGMPDLSPNPVNDLIGDSAAVVTISITEPGYASYTLTSNVRFYGLGGPTCDEVRNPTIDPTETTPAATKWSTKKGNTVPKVGKTIKVTPTRAPGFTVSYMWKVGVKVVDRDRALTVKKAYRGKKIAMVVTVTKPDTKTLQRRLGYGKAR